MAESCLNCGAVLTGEFCAACGQKKLHPDLTLGEFLGDATQELVQWEGKVPTTLRALFFQPGRLTLDFLAGRRARWLPPLRLYLICSLVYFLSGPLVEAVTHRAARNMARVTITNPDGTTSLTPETRAEIAAGLPARIFGLERMERAARDPKRLDRSIKSSFPKAMFVLLPLFAALTNIAWRSQHRRYPAHLYVALHLHAAWFGIFALGNIASIAAPTDALAVAVGVAALSYNFWYVLVALRRIFGDSWPRTLAKCAAIGAVYLLAFFVTSIAILGIAVATA